MLEQQVDVEGERRPARGVWIEIDRIGPVPHVERLARGEGFLLDLGQTPAQVRHPDRDREQRAGERHQIEPLAWALGPRRRTGRLVWTTALRLPRHRPRITVLRARPPVS